MRLSLVAPVLLALGALAAPTDSERKAKPHLVKGKVSFVLVGDSTTNNGTTLNSGSDDVISLSNLSLTHCLHRWWLGQRILWLARGRNLLQQSGVERKDDGHHRHCW